MFGGKIRTFPTDRRVLTERPNATVMKTRSAMPAESICSLSASARTDISPSTNLDPASTPARASYHWRRGQLRTRGNILQARESSAERHHHRIRTILEARRILLLASGHTKAEAVERALRDPVSESVPASALQLHPDVIAILDEAARAGSSKFKFGKPYPPSPASSSAPGKGVQSSRLSR